MSASIVDLCPQVPNGLIIVLSDDVPYMESIKIVCDELHGTFVETDLVEDYKLVVTVADPEAAIIAMAAIFADRGYPLDVRG